MMPIGSLGPGSFGRRRSTRLRPRVVFLAAVTALTLVVLLVISHHGSSDAGTSVGSRVESKSTSRHATTTVHTTTTLYEVALNPAWLAKGTSRYSDSAASKSLGDQLGLVSTTTTRAAVSGTTRGSSSTFRQSTTTTTFRRLTTTTREQPRVTSPTVAAAPTSTPPVAPPTAPPDTTPPDTTPPASPTP